MADSITVNGVVFELVPTAGTTVIYANGRVRIEDNDGVYAAFCGQQISRWRDKPELALAELARQAQRWAPVLAELARLGIGGGK